jgi:hypothetical protein
MSIDKWIFYLGMLVFLFMFIANPKGKAKVVLSVAFILFVFGPLLLPPIIFGKWNSIKELQNKTITKIIIKPYSNSSHINLTDTILELNNVEQIVHTRYLLENTTIYLAGHSRDIGKLH